MRHRVRGADDLLDALYEADEDTAERPDGPHTGYLYEALHDRLKADSEKPKAMRHADNDERRPE